MLPNGWLVPPAPGALTLTDTMPQGAAASPDGTTLAVVESGYNPASLRLYRTANLEQRASIPLKGAMGRPAWIDDTHVMVAGANADAIFDVDTIAQSVRVIALPAKSYPTALALSRDRAHVAVAVDGERAVRVGTLDTIATVAPVPLGGHPGGVAFTDDGTTLFAGNRQGARVVAVDTRTLTTRAIETGLHPTALAVNGDELYVAQTDADAIGVYDTRTLRERAQIFVGDTNGRTKLSGSSPNALAVKGRMLYVSLGAANAIAVIDGGRVARRIGTGWYPTDVVPIGTRLFVIDGKGEDMRANPHYVAASHNDFDYIGTIQYGSIRVYDANDRTANQQGARGWRTTSDPIVRTNGPIRHVFFILKENRTYDQVLGDAPGGNGDSKLVWFGHATTPNLHALAARFGLFDNTYTSGEVSDSGHNWADAAFANDYVERFWPSTYGGRRDEDDLANGTGASRPRNGYLWDAAARAHVTFRDYGEMDAAPSLAGRIDTAYTGWDLNVSDLDRVREWKREFDTFVRTQRVPQLEYIWLPNDHTAGSRPGRLTPSAYVAQNDFAVGKVVDAISHSPVWRSSAIFIIEDDAQDGADHVSAQRTTAYVVSPYARGGVNHSHYATVSMLRTIELMLGIAPLSAYDAMAVPMYDAFAATPHLAPYDAIAPRISITARNAKTAYGAATSAAMDFSRPDAARAGALLDVLAHNHEARAGAR